MERLPVIYILSQRYSGSTLLSFLMGTHPDIATIGERRKFYTYIYEQAGQQGQPCSCGQPFQQCPHWRQLKQEVEQSIGKQTHTGNPTEFKLSANKHVHRLKYEWFKWCAYNKMPLPFAAARKRNAAFNVALVQAALRTDGANAFLDSSKSIDHVLFLSLIPEIDLKVIWLTRDPRAQSNSAMKYNKWPASEAAKRWVDEMKANQSLLQALNIEHATIAYEALCRNPEQEMQQVLKFAQLDPTGFSLDFRDQQQHIMGNYSMRSGADTQIAERTEWLSELTSADRQTIEQITAEYTSYYSASC